MNRITAACGRTTTEEIGAYQGNGVKVFRAETVMTVILFYFVRSPTDVQLTDKLSHSSYMFRHYRVILRELAVSTLPGYTSMSNAVVGNTI